MKNYVKEGNVINFAHTSAVTSGQPLKIGMFLAVALGAYGANVSGAYAIKGVYNITKLTTDVVTAGALLYWDNGNSRLTLTATANMAAGRAMAAAGNGVTTVDIDLNVIGGTAVA
jgi:predicted RecA/RadA family phage recombinase